MKQECMKQEWMKSTTDEIQDKRNPWWIQKEIRMNPGMNEWTQNKSEAWMPFAAWHRDMINLSASHFRSRTGSFTHPSNHVVSRFFRIVATKAVKRKFSSIVDVSPLPWAIGPSHLWLLPILPIVSRLVRVWRRGTSWLITLPSRQRCRTSWSAGTLYLETPQAARVKTKPERSTWEGARCCKIYKTVAGLLIKRYILLLERSNRGGSIIVSPGNCASADGCISGAAAFLFQTRQLEGALTVILNMTSGLITQLPLHASVRSASCLDFRSELRTILRPTGSQDSQPKLCFGWVAERWMTQQKA